MKTFVFGAILLASGCGNSPSGGSGDATADTTATFDTKADTGKTCSDDSQCLDAEFCDNKLCKPDLCVSGTPATCDGTATKACAKNGSAYITTPCATGETCAAGQCKSSAPSCPPKEIKDDFAKSEQLSQAYKTCANNDGCAAKAGDADKVACFKACVGKVFTFTDSCGTCIGQYALCLFTTCKDKCSTDPSAKSCEACATTSCDPALAACK